MATCEARCGRATTFGNTVQTRYLEWEEHNPINVACGF